MILTYVIYILIDILVSVWEFILHEGFILTEVDLPRWLDVKTKENWQIENENQHFQLWRGFVEPHRIPQTLSVS